MIPPVREFRPRGAFVEEVRNLLSRNRLDVRSLAEMLGIDRTRLHQVLSQATPPPGPEVVDRLADVLDLGDDDRRWMQLLALRDRCDLPARALIELYEVALMKAWRTEDVKSIPERLGSQLELTNFVMANRPVYLRHSKRPLFVHVHDEDGELCESLVDGWIVEVEPAGMHGESFIDLAKESLVLLNDRRRCRIGWLKAQKGGKFHLVGDHGEPLTTGRAAAAGRSRGRGRDELDSRQEILVINKTAAHRPYLGDIQALIPRRTLEEIIRLRKEKLASTVHSIRRLRDSAQER